MKIIFLGLGIVAGIYISAEHPQVAVQIFDQFIDGVNWLFASVKSFFGSF